MSDLAPSTSKPKDASKPKKRFVGRSSRTPGKKGGSTVVGHQIPPEILDDPLLNKAIEQLPPNYSFEIHKTIHQIRKNGATMVALQMPEGLQMFACTISEIVEKFTTAITVILGDVTYGACCIDDYTAVALGCDMLVHYGHSCLVPIDTTTIKTLYVFVEIGIDNSHLTQTVRLNFPSKRSEFHSKLIENEEKNRQYAPGTVLNNFARLQLEGPGEKVQETDMSLETSPLLVNEKPTKLALVSTIQFVAAVQKLHEDLDTDLLTSHPEGNQGTASSESKGTSGETPSADVNPEHQSLVPSYSALLHKGRYDTVIPRSKPLSPGEILGCTAPTLSDDVDAILYVGDGRFHLESIMIANPKVPAFRYDPYSKKLTRERYDHQEMQDVRSHAVRAARKTITAEDAPEDANEEKPMWGVILGTLGRQGNFHQLQQLMHQLKNLPTPILFMPILISELSPEKLALFPSSHISTFVQTSCPRLSIDWGYAFPRPLLSTYEASVAIGETPGWTEDEGGSGVYPMDFYEVNGKAAQARKFVAPPKA